MKNFKRGTLIITIAVVFLIVVSYFWYLTSGDMIKQVIWRGGGQDVSVVSDTTLNDLTVADGETYVIKDDSTLTVDGNLTVNGTMQCENGSLNVSVKGNLTVNGILICEIPQELADDDLGVGISIVAEGDVEFTKDSYVISNGHVVLAESKEGLIESQEKLDELYEEAAKDEGEGPRIGPFIPISISTANPKIASATEKVEVKPEVIMPSEDSIVDKFKNLIIPGAQAAAQPAVDADGNPVPNTVRVGGTWIVGNPAAPPPGGIPIPEPPKRIKRILVVYNFGGRNMSLDDLILWGPDGKRGNDVKAGCDITAGDGDNAFRMNVVASNITINKFDLHLGNGGRGGDAETDKNCDPGKATGGNGGEASNFRFRAVNRINITGAMIIFPGQGGVGGTATAHGKDGKVGCPGEKGGDAIAVGGIGGDNKKGLKVKGNVQGIDQIEINDIVGGFGGKAIARAGNGGDGNACCDGGNGGKATATGGKGGDAASKTARALGGDGGDVTAVGGKGGNGGDCVKNKGGNGGKGGDATGTPGAGGQGSAINGAEGAVDAENGGDGGNGGDGCPEGTGGLGGAAATPGKKGADGKKVVLCEAPKTEATTGGLVGGGLGLDPVVVTKRHVIGVSTCPDNLSAVALTGPEGGSWQVDEASIPQWLSMSNTSGTFPTDGVGLGFNCNITDYDTHDENAAVKFSATDAEGSPAGEATLDVTMEIEAQ